GNFNVVAPAHQYLEESTNNDGGPGDTAGVYHITVSVTHDGLAATAPVTTDTITVNDVAVTVNANSGTPNPLAAINEQQSTPAATVIGTFTDTANPTGVFDPGQTALA